MHVHLQQTPNDLLVYVANGITTIRELTGRSDELRWRNEIARGERIGPSMWMSSSKTKQVSEPDVIRRVRYRLYGRATYQSAVVNDPGDADAFVADLKAQGYDYVKISSRIRPDIYDAVLAAAEQYEIPVVGHVPNDIDLDAFFASSQMEVTHIEELWGEPVRPLTGGIHPGTPTKPVETGMRAVANRMKEAGFWVTTTLSVGHAIAEQAYRLEERLSRPEVRYVDPR